MKGGLIEAVHMEGDGLNRNFSKSPPFMKGGLIEADFFFIGVTSAP